MARLVLKVHTSSSSTNALGDQVHGHRCDTAIKEISYGRIERRLVGEVEADRTPTFACDGHHRLVITNYWTYSST
jgi:hypothetical protein